MHEVDSLLGTMARLRADDGCPWDRQQTRESLRPYVLEEAFEVAEAIDGGHWSALREELGDLLFQVVFLAELAREQGVFEFADVVRTLDQKLLRRHPHVFGEKAARTVADAWKNWDDVKRDEQRERGEAPTSRLDGVPPALPALLKARLYADKAARAGFDWPDAAAIVDKITEETEELRREVERGDRSAAEEELGDLLFAAASLGRRLDVDPEGCLARANAKFSRRFRRVEEYLAQEGRRLEDTPAEELDRYWERAKQG